MWQMYTLEPGSVIELPAGTHHRVGSKLHQGPLLKTMYFGSGSLEETGIGFHGSLQEAAA